MKTLILLRHAEAVPPSEADSDKSRPLTRSGICDAKEAGSKSLEITIPDVIYASDSVRTRQTTENFLLKSGFSGQVHYLSSLYLSGAEAHFKCIQKIPNAYQTAMLVGHNPTFEEVLYCFSGKYQSFPKSAIMWFELSADSWKDVCPGMKAVRIVQHFPGGK